MERLKELGWTLADAVDCIERQGKPAPVMLFGKLAAGIFVSFDEDKLTLAKASGLMTVTPNCVPKGKK